MTFSRCGLLLLIQSPVTTRYISTQDGVHTVVTRTGAEEVVIDGGTGFRPGGFSTDFDSLVVQPGIGVGGVVQGAFGEDVVDIPLTGEGRKDSIVAGSLSLIASRVGSATGALEDLVLCRVNEA